MSDDYWTSSVPLLHLAENTARNDFARFTKSHRMRRLRTIRVGSSIAPNHNVQSLSTIEVTRDSKGCC